MAAVKSEGQMQRLGENSVGEANGEVSFKAFQWREKKWDTEEVRVRKANFWKGPDSKYFRLCELVFS